MGCCKSKQVDAERQPLIRDINHAPGDSDYLPASTTPADGYAAASPGGPPKKAPKPSVRPKPQTRDRSASSEQFKAGLNALIGHGGPPPKFGLRKAQPVSGADVGGANGAVAVLPGVHTPAELVPADVEEPPSEADNGGDNGGADHNPVRDRPRGPKGRKKPSRRRAKTTR